MHDSAPTPGPVAPPPSPAASAAARRSPATLRKPRPRLEIAWLTIVSLAAAALLAALRPEGDGSGATLARNAAQLRAALGDTPSIATHNLLRAQLAADMLFLLAYGLLLRASILYLHPARGRRRTAAVAGVLVLMGADAVENVSALGILRRLTDLAETDPAAWRFALMNAAALVKWVAAGLVLLWLAVAWSRWRGHKRWRRVAAVVIAAGFGIGGLGSLYVAITWLGVPGRGVAAGAALLGPAAALLLQFRIVDLTGVMLRFLYLARVPLLVLLIAAAFGPVALGPAAGLLGGIIDVATPWGIGVLTAACLVLAYACVTPIALVRAYGWQRMFDQTLRILRGPVMARAIWWTALAAVASLLFATGVASLRLGLWQIAGGVLGGAIAGGLFVAAQELIAAWVTHSTDRGRLARLPLASRHSPLIGRWVRAAHAAPPPAPVEAVKASLRNWSIAGWLFGLHSGYVDVDAAGRRRLLPGHVLAATQFALSIAFYLALLEGKLPVGAPETETGLWVPTAASVVLLLLLCSWTLAGLTFFLDRYRWPIFTAGLGALVLTGSCPATDHRVPTAGDGVRYALTTPGSLLGAFDRPLVVAAAGGGIQAGAWTARVLEGIDRDLGGTLHQRLAVVSAVSGGSMGALYYGAYDGASLREATRRSMEPSLDEIASALIGSDTLRLAGISTEVDRGVALERSWAQRLPAGGDLTLRGWSERVGRVARREPGVRPFPAFLFNTTVVETGQPAAFATTQFPTGTYRQTFVRQLEQYPVVESANGLFDLMEGDRALDVRLQAVTAARLSAAFPYVSPAATLDLPNRPRYHLVDGGYYDNYGLVALSQWLDDALMEMAARPPAIDILIVRGLVASESEVDRDLRRSEETRRLKVDAHDVPNRGWGFQVTAPPSAFLKTREFGQWAGGNQVLRLLKEKWAGRVALNVHLFDYPVERLPEACRLAPLSWKLTVTQQQCIEDGWRLSAGETFGRGEWQRAR